MRKKASNSDRTKRDFEYDVCLSFAGEERAYVDKVASVLRARGIRVFYDNYEKTNLWGKDLYTHLDEIYQNAARYCVLFASKNYAKKLWTNHERQSAQARAFAENEEYILPAKFDETAIPGVRPTVGYINLKSTSPEELAELIIGKIGPRQRFDYFPPFPDKLFAALGVKTKSGRSVAISDAYAFIQSLRRMSEDEMRAVITMFLHGCPTELPNNIHISLDLLRRLTGEAPAKLARTFRGLGSLGYEFHLRDEEIDQEEAGSDEAHTGPMAVLTFHNLTGTGTEEATAVASAIVELAGDDLCNSCGLAALFRLDFSQLSTQTSDSDSHRASPRATAKPTSSKPAKNVISAKKVAKGSNAKRKQ